HQPTEDAGEGKGKCVGVVLDEATPLDFGIGHVQARQHRLCAGVCGPKCNYKTKQQTPSQRLARCFRKAGNLRDEDVVSFRREYEREALEVLLAMRGTRRTRLKRDESLQRRKDSKKCKKGASRRHDRKIVARVLKDHTLADLPPPSGRYQERVGRVTTVWV